MSVLTVTAGLFLMLSFSFHFFADGFTIGNLRNRKFYFCAEFCFQFRNGNFEMLFTKSAENLFFCKRVLFISKSGVFFDKSLHTAGDFAFIPLILGSDGHRVAGVRKCRHFGFDNIAGCTESITSRSGNLDSGNNITSFCGFDFCLLLAEKGI